MKYVGEHLLSAHEESSFPDLKDLSLLFTLYVDLIYKEHFINFTLLPPSLLAKLIIFFKHKIRAAVFGVFRVRWQNRWPVRT